MRRLSLMAFVAQCAFAALAASGPIRLEKKGTIDTYIVEANPIVFRGRPYLMEYIRYKDENRRYRGNTTGDSYFRFRDMTDLKTVTPAFGKGLHMGNAFVHDGRIYVTAVEDWGKGRFYQLESDDMVHWTEPRVILENPAWAGYNTTLCKAGDRFVLSFELGRPRELVGKSFTMFFAESKDLRTWKVVEGASMGADRYTGAPMLRWFDGWFYYFHLEGSYADGFRTRVARSRDLRDWEFSPHVVLDFDGDDRRIHPAAEFSAEEREFIRTADDINASDLDMCEFGGKLVCCYSWGNQRGKELFALAEADCSEREFCESFFPAAAPIRAVQLDLARQKETVPFVKEYMGRMAAAGYNTVVLYLEDRVKTASYPYPADAESYLPDEIREIVSAGTALGLDLVPVVSPLGHTERFLRHDALKRFGEQCEGQGRWGKTDNPGCFCLTDPAARAWMENYITEVSALFPGKNLHLGFDETWNLGYCTRCRPAFEKEGLGALYLRHVLWAHGLATRLGKRMWMWDDFFEYVPEQLEKVPRDVLMCCWNYDRNIERTGPRAHFGGRLRRDNLAIYERLGFEALVCPWFDYENVRTITEYAASRKAAGYFFTQWEMETDFHSIFYPRVLAGAALWSGAADLVSGEWITKTLRTVYPSLDADTLRLVEGLTFDQSKLKFTTVTVDSILNGVHENSKLRYWRTALARLQAQPSEPGRGAVPPDQFSEAAFVEDLTVRTEMAILCEETRNAARYLYLPDRTAGQSVSAKRELRRIRARWDELVARRAAQWATWRPGIVSEKEGKYRAHLPAVIDAALAKGDVAEASEWLFEIDLAMTDTHGCPQWTVEVRDADGAWKEIAAGTWKPKSGDHPYAAKLVPVSLDRAPAAMRLSCGGYGAGEACHVSLRSAKTRLVPVRVLSVSGEVRDAENLLKDDFLDCRMGLPDCPATFLRPERATRRASVELQLAP